MDRLHTNSFTRETNASVDLVQTAANAGTGGITLVIDPEIAQLGFDPDYFGGVDDLMDWTESGIGKRWGIGDDEEEFPSGVEHSRKCYLLVITH